jgi:hypothetical protein
MEEVTLLAASHRFVLAPGRCRITNFERLLWAGTAARVVQLCAAAHGDEHSRAARRWDMFGNAVVVDTGHIGAERAGRARDAERIVACHGRPDHKVLSFAARLSPFFLALERRW